MFPFLKCCDHVVVDTVTYLIETCELIFIVCTLIQWRIEMHQSEEDLLPFELTVVISLLPNVSLKLFQCSCLFVQIHQNQDILIYRWNHKLFLTFIWNGSKRGKRYESCFRIVMHVVLDLLSLNRTHSMSVAKKWKVFWWKKDLNDSRVSWRSFCSQLCSKKLFNSLRAYGNNTSLTNRMDVVVPSISNNTTRILCCVSRSEHGHSKETRISINKNFWWGHDIL